MPEVAPAHQPVETDHQTADAADEDEEETAKRLAIEAPGLKFDHRTDLTCFGGVRPWLRHGEAWPRCGNGDCTQLMQFFLQIDFRFAPVEARQKFVGDDANKLLQMFTCWACEEDTVEHFSKAVLLRFVPLPPAGPDAPGGAPSLLSLASRSVAHSLDANPDKDVKEKLELTGLDKKVALMADAAANEDPAAQLARRPHGHQDRVDNGTLMEHFPLKRLVKWVAQDDWPNFMERPELVTEHHDEAEVAALPQDAYYSCKLGGYAPWVQAVDYASCPECDAPMTNLVFNISEDEAIPWDWGGNGTGQIMQCPTHLDVLAFTWAV